MSYFLLVYDYNIKYTYSIGFSFIVVAIKRMAATRKLQQENGIRQVFNWIQNMNEDTE